MQQRLLLCTTIIVLAVTACSPRIYKDEAKTFADATMAARQAFDGARAAQAQAAISSATAAAIADRVVFSLAEDCTKASAAFVIYQNETAGTKPLTEDARRRLGELLKKVGECVVVRKKGNDAERHVPPNPARQGRLLMKEIGTYGALLAELAGAEDIDGVNTKATELNKAIQSFAGAVGEGAGAEVSDVSAFVEPVTAFMQWIGLNYLNHKRYLTLKRAVNAAHPLLEQAEPLLTTQMMGLALSDLIEKERALQNRLALSDTSKEVLAAVADAEVLAQSGKANATSVFRKLVKAHAELRAELEDPTTQRGALSASLKDFKEHAEALISAFGGD